MIPEINLVNPVIFFMNFTKMRLRLVTQYTSILYAYSKEQAETAAG